MESPIKYFVGFLIFVLLISPSVSSSSPSLSSSLSMCYPPRMITFLHDLQLQCPTTIFSSWPIQMDGESLDKLLSSSQADAYTAILFYASWCPFSRNLQSTFAALSSMYPKIKHVMVEQTSVLPSVFSRHGIHSVPSVLIVSRTSRMRHHGPKDLHSLSRFYQRATGLEPVVDLPEDQICSREDRITVLQQLNITSIKDTVVREPYLVLSALFLLLKAFLYVCPNIVSNVTALWLAYIPRLNLAIFGESRQLLARALHLVDVKRAFSKLKFSKSRNFRNGARNARVWASSLASVSLGETSSARASHGGDL